jgi:hypothetical protein
MILANPASSGRPCPTSRRRPPPQAAPRAAPRPTSRAGSPWLARPAGSGRPSTKIAILRTARRGTRSWTSTYDDLRRHRLLPRGEPDGAVAGRAEAPAGALVVDQPNRRRDSDPAEAAVREGARACARRRAALGRSGIEMRPKLRPPALRRTGAVMGARVSGLVKEEVAGFEPARGLCPQTRTTDALAHPSVGIDCRISLAFSKRAWAFSVLTGSGLGATECLNETLLQSH